jgi:hypothetical protein
MGPRSLKPIFPSLDLFIQVLGTCNENFFAIITDI